MKNDEELWTFMLEIGGVLIAMITVAACIIAVLSV